MRTYFVEASVADDADPCINGHHFASVLRNFVYHYDGEAHDVTDAFTALRADLAAAMEERERLRGETVGGFAAVGISMLVDADPTGPGEIKRAIRRLASERDAALRRAEEAGREAESYKLDIRAFQEPTPGASCLHRMQFRDLHGSCVWCRAEEAEKDAKHAWSLYEYSVFPRHNMKSELEAAEARLAESINDAGRIADAYDKATARLAEAVAVLRMVAAEGCRDEAGSGVSCKDAAIPPDDICEVCKVIAFLATLDEVKTLAPETKEENRG